MNWETPTCVKDIQAFIGFTNFYWRFVQGFSKVVASLIALVRKDILFKWIEECQKFFKLLKERFTTALILVHFDSTKEIIVKTDASDWVSTEILSQYSDDNILCPVAFFSKKHSVQEVNYEIYDKELLVIICAFEEWWPELEGSAFPLKIITDHQNLEYFMSTKQLSCRQAWWSEFLSRFNFKIVYRPEKQGAKPDALTRWSEDLLKGRNVRLQQQSQVVLKLHNLELMANSVQNNDLEDNIYSENNAEEEELTLKQLFEAGHQQDSFPHKVLQQLHDSERRFKEIMLSECTEIDEQLHYRGRVYVPDHHSLWLCLCKEHYDTSVAEYPEKTKTYELLIHNYYWPNMQRFVNQYVQNCHICTCTKTPRHAKFEVLWPLSVPQHRWKDMTIDFIVSLSLVDGYDSVCVSVNRLTKKQHLTACHFIITSEGLVNLFIRDIFRLHGLPDSVTSDRRPQFIGAAWKQVCRKLEIKA